MKSFFFVLLACLPLTAMAYPIEVQRQMNGAEVSVTPQEIDHNMAALLLNNYGARAAECTAVFRNGPESPRTRKVFIEPGATSSLTAKFTRSIIRLRVKLDCAPK